MAVHAGASMPKGGELKTVSGSLSRNAEGRHRGMVDIFDYDRGIEGWAMDVENPSTPLTLVLRVENQIVARTVADRSRDDISSAIGTNARVGFAFLPDIYERIADMVEMGFDGPLTIGIGETLDILPTRAAATNALEVSKIYRTRQGQSLDGFDMLARLSSLRAEATLVAQRPLRLDPEKLIGFVEQFALDESGLVWVGGWMKSAIAADLSVVIVDDQRAPAGMAITMCSREDLSGGACGIIGAIQSEWRPKPGADVVFLFSDGSYLQAVKTPQIVSKRDFADHFNYRWPQCHSGHGTALRHLLDHPDSWQPMEGLSGARVRAALEEVYFLPSFGCIVTGWALSPIKEIRNFGIRFGTTVLKCDELSLSFRPRPDLASMAAGCDLVTRRAGFTAVFRGIIGSRDLDSPTLKIILSDGSTSNHAIDVNAVRRLGTAASANQLLHLYPSLTSEPFFPDLAIALRRDARQRAQNIAPASVSHCANALIFAVPEERSDAFLLFAELDRRTGPSVADKGFIFIAGRGLARATIMSLYGQFAKRRGSPCSLFLVDDVADALYALPEVLRTIGADFFAFLGAGIVPTDRGWAAMTADNDAFTFLSLQDIAQHGLDKAASMSAFSWRRDAFLQWFKSFPPFIGGEPPEIEALPRQGDVRRISNGAWFTRPRALSRLDAATNRVPVPVA